MLDDPERGIRRVVIGATAGAPIVLEGDVGAGPAALHAANIREPHKRQVLEVALRRAMTRMAA